MFEKSWYVVNIILILVEIRLSFKINEKAEILKLYFHKKV